MVLGCGCGLCEKAELKLRFRALNHACSVFMPMDIMLPDHSLAPQHLVCYKITAKGVVWLVGLTRQ